MKLEHIKRESSAVIIKEYEPRSRDQIGGGYPAGILVAGIVEYRIELFGRRAKANGH